MSPRCAVALLAVTACDVGSLNLSGLPCPCTGGYHCDMATDTCVPGPPPTGGGGTDSGGMDGSGIGGDGGRGLTDTGTDGDARGSTDSPVPIACDAGLAGCGGQCVDIVTDAHNCGSCGHDCLGGSCMGGACQPYVLSTSVGAVWAMGEDTANLYWVTSGGFLYKVAKSGGMQAALAASSDRGAALVVSGATVLWATMNGTSADTTFWSCPISGCTGAGTMLATIAATTVTNMVVIGTTVVFGGLQKGIYTFPITGGTPASIVADFAGGVATDGTSVYWVAGSVSQSGTLQRCSPASCGAPTTLVSGLGQPTMVAVDATNAYVGENFFVAKCPLGGCSSATTLACDEAPVHTIAFDATQIYWVDKAAAFSVPIAGGMMRGLPVPSSVSAGDRASAIVVDGTAVYWSEVVQTETSPDNVIVALAK